MSKPADPYLRTAKGKFAGTPGPGRPKGSREKLQEAFIAALHADFLEHGPVVVQAARAADPVQYLNVIAKIIPKEQTVTHVTEGMSLDELDRVIEFVRDRLGSSVAGASGEAPEAAGGKPASNVSPVH